MSTDKIEKSKDELADTEMDKVTGGGTNTTTKTVTTHDISVTKTQDSASSNLLSE